MASQSGFVVENKFIQGLNTQSTALNFPQDAATDMDNCIIDEFGKVARRPGIDFEDSYGMTAVTFNATYAFTEYNWYTSATDSNQAFLVQQIGNILHFFDITSTTKPSQSHVTTVNLNTYLPTGSPNDSALYPAQYATGNGDLLVVTQVTDPIYISWDSDTASLSVNRITVKHRDTDGLDDGLAVDKRPAYDDTASLVSGNPEHYYNIINQGWYVPGALSQLSDDTTLSNMPSNADAVSYYRKDATDPFDPDRFTHKSPGNSPAPKGHFILNVGEDDRAGALAAGGFSSISLDGNNALIAGNVGTIIGDMTTSSSTAFDNKKFGKVGTDTSKNPDVTYSEAAHKGTSSTSAYIGKNLGTGNGIKVNSVTICSPTSWNFTSGFNQTTVRPGGFTLNSDNSADDGPSITVTLYGSNSAPSSSTDGTSLGSSTFTDQQSKSVNIVSNDNDTVYQYVWVRFSQASSRSWYCSELQIYQSTAVASYTRFTAVQFYAGRAWYAGLNSGGSGSQIYFSQVVTTPSRYGLCYQKNDPTSEDFADLLADDGGVIQIPEMGKVQTMFAFQSQLLIFADNGAWIVSGGANQGFSATGYQVRRITNIGMNSPYSVVDVKGVPCWWAEDGIYTVTYDPNYDSTAVKSLTEETVKDFVISVPGVNRPYIKAAFDRVNNYVYWLFSKQETDTGSTLTFFRYDGALVFNAKTAAFMPYSWELGTFSLNVPYISGVSYVEDGNKTNSSDFAIKLTTFWEDNSSNDVITYSQFRDVENWKDFVSYSAYKTSADDYVKDYSSYLIAGYRIDAQAMRNFQSKYIWSFLENQPDASIYVQGLWDFTNSGNSGKWSTPQQAYNSLTTKGRTYDDVRVSRRMVRGTGKALQVKYYSESGKPFKLIGWGLFESGVDAP